MLPIFHFSKNSFLNYALNVVLWGIVILFALELCIRFFIIRPVPLVSDPNWDFIPVSGSCGFQALEGYGKTCYSDNNEVETPFNNGISIVVLGDSYTEAIQVDNSEKYVTLTELALRKQGLAVNLINLGDSNRTIADFVYLAPKINALYHPKIVVLQTNEFGLFDSLNPDRANYYAARSGQGGLELIHREPADHPMFVQNIIQSSGLLSLTTHRWEKTTEEMFGPHDDLNEPPRASMAQLSDEIHQFVVAYPDSQIVVLVIPSIPILYPGKINPIWDNPNDTEILSALASIDEITVVYPARNFREMYKEYRVFPRGFFNSLPNYGHLNRYGHIAVANALTAALDLLLK